MSYIRVIPRDLFNEANLLKCYGALYIALEGKLLNGGYNVEDVERFEIVQDQNTGALYVENLPLVIGTRQFRLTRPLNARRPFPLYAEAVDDLDFDPVEVFNDDGSLTTEFLHLVAGA